MAFYCWPPRIGGITFFFFAINLSHSFIQVLIPPIVLAFTNARVLGIIMSAGALGYLGGSILMSVWGGARRRASGLIGSAVMYAAGVMLAGMTPSATWITVSIFILFLQLPVMNAYSQAIWQIKTPAGMQGRIFSTRIMLAWSSVPLATFLAGPLADRVFDPLLRSKGALASTWISCIGVGPGRGTALLLILNGMLVLLVAVKCYFNPRFLGLEEELPDSVQLIESEVPSTEKIIDGASQ